MKNEILEKLYLEEMDIRDMYEAGKADGNEGVMNGARELMRAFREELEQDEELGWVYAQYESMRKRGNLAIDLDDLHRDETVPSVVRVLKEYGVEEFTFSSTWSSAVATLYELVKCGCQVKGMRQVNSKYTAFDSNEYEKVPAVVLEIC